MEKSISFAQPNSLTKKQFQPYIEQWHVPSQNKMWLYEFGICIFSIGYTKEEIIEMFIKYL